MMGQIERSQTNVGAQIDYGLKSSDLAYDLPVYFVHRNFMERRQIRTCLTQRDLSPERAFHVNFDDTVSVLLSLLYSKKIVPKAKRGNQRHSRSPFSEEG